MGEVYSIFKQQKQIRTLITKTKNNDISAMHELAEYYKLIEDIPKYQLYLGMACNQGDLNAMIKLSKYYLYKLKKYYHIVYETKMEIYSLMAYNKGNKQSLTSLIEYFVKKNDDIKVEQYCLQLYNDEYKTNKNINALLYLINYYQTRKNTSGVIKYGLILMNENVYWTTLIISYFKESNLEDKFDQIEKYYKIAYKNGLKEAIIDLATYFNQNRINKKDMFFEIATKNNDTYTIQKLQSLYKDIYRNLKIEGKIEECMICYEEKQMYSTRCNLHCICHDCIDILYDKPCPMCRQ